MHYIVASRVNVHRRKDIPRRFSSWVLSKIVYLLWLVYSPDIGLINLRKLDGKFTCFRSQQETSKTREYAVMAPPKSHGNNIVNATTHLRPRVRRVVDQSFGGTVPPRHHVVKRAGIFKHLQYANTEKPFVQACTSYSFVVLFNTPAATIPENKLYMQVAEK